MLHKTDALVVGGSAIGAGIARDLALCGVDVTLVGRAPSAGPPAVLTGCSTTVCHAEADRVGAEKFTGDGETVTGVEGPHHRVVLREIGDVLVVDGVVATDDFDPVVARRERPSDVTEAVQSDSYCVCHGMIVK